MKNALIFAGVLVIALAAALILFKPKSPLKEAEAAESRGEYQKACNLYVDALREKTDGMTLPDKNRAMVVKPEEWLSEVQQYMRWVQAPPAPMTAEVTNILAALSRCTTFVEQTQYTTDDSMAVYDKYYQIETDWKRAFFPRGMAAEGDPGPLVKEALHSAISILRITSMRSYMYTGLLLDMASGKRIDFTLAPEDEVSLLVRPGRYLLISACEVEFADGAMWHSPQNIMELFAPDSSSFKTFILKTKVNRAK